MEHKVVKKTEVKVEEAKSKKDRELQEPKMSSEAELRNIVKPLHLITISTVSRIWLSSSSTSRM